MKHPQPASAIPAESMNAIRDRIGSFKHHLGCANDILDIPFSGDHLEEQYKATRALAHATLAQIAQIDIHYLTDRAEGHIHNAMADAS